MLKFMPVAIIVFLVSVSGIRSAAAQDEPGIETVAVAIPVAEEKGPEDALGRGTPRGSARGFLLASSEFDIGLGLYYQAFRLDLDVDSSGWHGKAELDQHGPILSLSGSW